MKILVTGASGNAGEAVSRLLTADESLSVRRADVAPPPGGTPAGAEFVRCDTRTPDDARRAVEGVDAVIHLAAALTSRGAAEPDFVRSNVMGTYSLLAALRDEGRPIERFVYVSSDAVYWAGLAVPARYLPVDEHHPLETGSLYGVTKLAAEELCRTFERAWGLPFAIVRPTATADAAELIAPDGVFVRRFSVRPAIRALEALAAPDAAELDLLAALRGVDDGRDRLFTVAAADGTTAHSTLNDARHAADGLVLALEHPAAAGEAFNIGPLDGYDQAALMEHLGSRLGLPSVVLRSRHARASWVVSSARAQRLLGYRPTGSVFTMVDRAFDDAGGPR